MPDGGNTVPGDRVLFVLMITTLEGSLQSRSTIGKCGDTTIPSPGRSPKQPLPGIGLHDPLHGRQACPEFNSFHQGVGQIYPREGLFSCRLFPKRGQFCYIPAPPPQSLNGSTGKKGEKKTLLVQYCTDRGMTNGEELFSVFLFSFLGKSEMGVGQLLVTPPRLEYSNSALLLLFTRKE